MPLYLQADRIDELPESLRSSAKEIGGKFLSGLGELSVEDTRGLKGVVAKERKARKLAEDKAKEFDWRLSEDGETWSQEGLDANSARDALDKLKSGGLKSAKEIDDFKQQLQAKVERDRREQENSSRTVEMQLREMLVKRQAMEAIQSEGGNLRLLLPVVESAAKVERDGDGRLQVTLVDDAGKVLITQRANSTDPMGFREYVQGLKRLAEFKPAFNSPGAGGSGSTSQHGGSARAGIGGGNTANLSPMELIQRANDRTAAGIGR